MVCDMVTFSLMVKMNENLGLASVDSRTNAQLILLETKTVVTCVLLFFSLNLRVTKHTY